MDVVTGTRLYRIAHFQIVSDVSYECRSAGIIFESFTRNTSFWLSEVDGIHFDTRRTIKLPKLDTAFEKKIVNKV